MFSVDPLASQTIKEFTFLEEAGHPLENLKVIEPQSFKGGFRLEYRCRKEPLVVTYLDMEFSALHGERELFGAEVHPGFSGNMFSREHLAEHLPAIAIAVRTALSLG
jgi:hypothetical protein